MNVQLQSHAYVCIRIMCICIEVMCMCIYQSVHFVARKPVCTAAETCACVYEGYVYIHCGYMYEYISECPLCSKEAGTYCRVMYMCIL
jgi:hypothetical protein